MFFYLFISPLFNQVGQLRTSSHLQLRPGQESKAVRHIQQHRVTHGISKHTTNNTVKNIYIQHLQMRKDKRGKAINRPWWWSNYNITINHWNGRWRHIWLHLLMWFTPSQSKAVWFCNTTFKKYIYFFLNSIMSYFPESSTPQSNTGWPVHQRGPLGSVPRPFPFDAMTVINKYIWPSTAGRRLGI